MAHFGGILCEEFYAGFLPDRICCEIPGLWCDGNAACVYPYLTAAVAMDSHAIECLIILLKTPATWESVKLHSLNAFLHSFNCPSVRLVKAPSKLPIGFLQPWPDARPQTIGTRPQTIRKQNQFNKLKNQMEIRTKLL